MEEMLASFKPARKRVRREVGYRIPYSYGRRKAPDQPVEGDTDTILAAAAKLAGVVAPGAVKVNVSSMHRYETKSVKL